jgi:uncharacterized protein (TIGR03000 family)
MYSRLNAITVKLLVAGMFLGTAVPATAQGRAGARGGAVGGYHPSSFASPSVPLFPHNVPAPRATTGPVNAYRPNSGYIPYVGYYLPESAPRSRPAAPGLGSFGQESLTEQVPMRPGPPRNDVPVEQQPEAAARVTVRLPANAELWFGDKKVPTPGTIREFKTPVLRPGRLYEYEVRARWTKDGRVVTQTQQVVVTAGAATRVDFTPSAGAAP